MSGDRESTWYVKASFGAEWGPMMTATLLEMDERGSLGPGDLARCGNSGDWRSVAEVLRELADGSAPPARRTTSGDETPNCGDENSAVAGEPDDDEAISVPDSPELVEASERGSGALPGWSNFWTASVTSPPTESVPKLNGLNDWRPRDSEDSFAEPGEMPLTTKLSGNQTLTDHIAIAPQPVVSAIRSEPSDGMTDTSDPLPDDLTLPDKDLELFNDWKQSRTDTLTRLMGIVAQREADIVRAEEEAKAQAADEAMAAKESSSDVDSEAASDAASKPQVAAARPRRATRSESWDETLARWKRSLPDWKVAVAVVLLPVVVWWLWPVSYGGVAANYHSMYNKLREIRDRPLDKSGMAEFVERSQAQLDMLLPRLEKRANSKDPDTLLLLWIGRDCLKPMLKSPRTRNSKHEDMLKKLLAQWDEEHHIVRTEEPAESSHPKSEEIEILTPPPGSKPLGFGQSSDLGESNEPELPAATRSSQREPRRGEDKDEN